ncbi:hypothetical protein RCC89_00580 [Cytophagaceae bacterium ABcell3]|nr:hypothetical protein RCC89_00580 [Cytophagaceae bacterium ABcell3]
MKKFFIGLTIACSCLSFTESKGQAIPGYGYHQEALQFSRTTFGGSARYMGIGGAATALGGDIGTVHNNPAGLGFYRRSEVSGTPALNFGNSNGHFLGQSTQDRHSRLNINNFGAVFADPAPDYGDNVWRGGAFGVSFTRTNNFNNQYTIGGMNHDNSMTYHLADISQGFHWNDDRNHPPIDMIDLALSSAMFDSDETGRFHFPINEGVPSYQEETVRQRGGQFQWDIGYGGNFGDVVYLGGSIGIARIRQTTERTYYEQPDYTGLETYEDDIRDFEIYDYNEIRGTGINLNLGAIVVPTDWIRFGLNFKSPTWYTMNEEYFHVLHERFWDNYEQELETTFNTYRFHLTTPMRVSAGMALFSGKNGFISADVEYVDYSTAAVRNPDSPRELRGDNAAIQNLYRGTVNVNVGAEYRFDMYRLRSGFALLGDPLERPDDINRNVFNFTVGGGVRLPDFYIDAALVHSRTRFSYAPYTLTDEIQPRRHSYDPLNTIRGDHPIANIRRLNTNFIVSVGTFF